MASMAFRKVARGCAMVGAAWAAAIASADSGLYLGASAVAGRFGAEYAKAVINAAPSPRAGRTFRDGGADESWQAGYGVLVGYRLDLGDTFHVSAEVDLLAHDADVGGRLAGVGESPGRNQPGESWPDDWTMTKNRSYGLAVKAGAAPAFLSAVGADLYALVGLRRVKADFRLGYFGCLEPLDCVAEQLSRGALDRNQDFAAWTLGVGVEKSLTSRFALRGEARFTQYADEDWLSFDLNGIRVPAELGGDDLDVAVSLIWHP